jgi:hypothetical protein
MFRYGLAMVMSRMNPNLIRDIPLYLHSGIKCSGIPI